MRRLEQRFEDFNRDGFDVWRGGLARDAVEAAGTAIRRLFDSPASVAELTTDLRAIDRGLDRIFNVHTAVPAAARICSCKHLLDQAAARLAVESVRVFYTQTVLKHPARDGDQPSGRGVVGWHQDFAYWGGATAPRMLTAWIPFAPVRTDGGGLLYRRRTSVTDSMLLKGFNNINLSLTDEHGGPPSGTSLDVGDVAFHHCLTRHASVRNQSRLPRLALAVHLVDVTLLPIDLARCHHSLAFLRGLDPTLAH